MHMVFFLRHPTLLVRYIRRVRLKKTHNSARQKQATERAGHGEPEQCRQQGLHILAEQLFNRTFGGCSRPRIREQPQKRRAIPVRPGWLARLTGRTLLQPPRPAQSPIAVHGASLWRIHEVAKAEE